MPFDSFQDFIIMGGYGLYVCLSSPLPSTSSLGV